MLHATLLGWTCPGLACASLFLAINTLKNEDTRNFQVARWPHLTWYTWLRNQWAVLMFANPITSDDLPWHNLSARHQSHEEALRFTPGRWL